MTCFVGLLSVVLLSVVLLSVGLLSVGLCLLQQSTHEVYSE